MELSGGRNFQSAASDSELRRELGTQTGSSQTAAQRPADSRGPGLPGRPAHGAHPQGSLETFIQWLWDQAHGTAFLKHLKRGLRAKTGLPSKMPEDTEDPTPLAVMPPLSRRWRG